MPSPPRLCSGSVTIWRPRSTSPEPGAWSAAGLGDFSLTEADVAPVKALLAQGDATAGDLGLDLGRRLVLAGLAVVG